MPARLAKIPAPARARPIEPGSRLANPYLIALVLVAATVAVYAQVASFDFVNFDDYPYVTDNAHVKAGLTVPGVVWAFAATTQSNWHPLTWLSLMLDAQIGGLSPRVFHLTNLLFHIANVLLVFYILRRITGFDWRSAVVAALFAIHPLHVESVAWVAERKDVLSTFFWLLTMLAYGCYAAKPRAASYLLVTFLFALGLMAKPMLVTLPMVLLLIDFWPLGRLPGAVRVVVLEKLPLLALSIVSSIVTVIAQDRGGALVSLESHSTGARIGNALVAYVAYLRQMIWPQGLAALYPHPRGSLSPAIVLGSIMVLALLTAVAVREASHRPYLTVGWFWYLITLVPVIGLVQVGNQARADRYTYVPLLGPFIAVVWWSAESVAAWVRAGNAPQRERQARALLGAASIAALLPLAACAYVQVGYWRNSLTLYERALEVTRDNAVVENNLGEVYSRLERTDEAIVHFREAMRINPGYSVHQTNLSRSLIKQGYLEEGIALSRDAIKKWPEAAPAHHNLGLGLLRMVKREGARVGRLPSAAVDPTLAAGLRVLQLEGIAALREALHLDPNSYDASLNLGVAMAEEKNYGEAVAHFSEALRIRPGDPVATQYLGIASTRQRAAR